MGDVQITAIIKSSAINPEMLSHRQVNQPDSLVVLQKAKKKYIKKKYHHHDNQSEDAALLTLLINY